MLCIVLDVEFVVKGMKLDAFFETETVLLPE